jgi:hypothetical protein
VDGEEGVSVNADWTATYDLAAAASEVWAEKAAGLAANYDYSSDGASLSRSQAYEQALRQSRYYAARRRAGSIRLRPSPRKLDEEESV